MRRNYDPTIWTLLIHLLYVHSLDFYINFDFKTGYHKYARYVVAFVMDMFIDVLCCSKNDGILL